MEIKVIISMSEMVKMELETNREVWVLAPDIALGPSVYKETMVKNLGRGIIYKYLVSNDIDTQDDLLYFYNDISKEVSMLNFQMGTLPKEIIESDVTILDPNTKNEVGFILPPCEIADKGWKLRGSALYRQKRRFKTLWRGANKLSVENNRLVYKEKKNFTKFWSAARNSINSSMLESLDCIGKILTKEKPINEYFNDWRHQLICEYLDYYIENQNDVPVFDNIDFPNDINTECSLISKEILRSHFGRSYSASIGLSGKLMELVLKYIFLQNSKKKLDRNIGLGKLIRLVHDNVQVEFDKGIYNIINFINKYRIVGVHSKTGKEIPTLQQSEAVLLMCYDTLTKLFGLKTIIWSLKRMKRNKDFNWNKFDISSYIRDNYSTISSADKYILEKLVKFHRSSTNGGKMIEVGCGPNLYPVLAAFPFRKKMDITDLSNSNIKYILKQIEHGLSKEWENFLDLLKSIDSENYIKSKYDILNLRKKINIYRKSIFNLPKNKYDIASMHFVAESITSDFDEFIEACKSFLFCLHKNGRFIATFMAESEGYKTGSKFFPAVFINEKIVKDIFDPLTINLNIERVPNNFELVRTGYSGMIITSGKVY